MLKRPTRIPVKAGVYFFRGKGGQVLYIGKAASLRSRLASYFNSQPKEPKVAAMLKEASKVDWQEVDSEIEALILESQLIKKHRTPFNILMRDDKQYAYVVFTKEEFPRIYVTHQPGQGYRVKGKGYRTKLSPIRYALYANSVGPFTETYALKETLKLLRRVFPYCTCKQLHSNYCLNYHIGKCLGFCCKRPERNTATERERGSTKAQQRVRMAGAVAEAIDRKEYIKNIRAIKDILSGKKKNIARQLEKAMQASGKSQQFERAIRQKYQLEKLHRVFENARVIRQLEGRKDALLELQEVLSLPEPPSRIECYDIANIQGQYATGAMVVFTNGQPDKNQYRKFRIRTSEGGDVAMLQEILERRFNHPEWEEPGLIIIDGGKAQINAAIAAIPTSTPIISLTKDEKHQGSHIFVNKKKNPIKLADLPAEARNLILQIDAEAHRFAITYYRKIHRREFAR